MGCDRCCNLCKGACHGAATGRRVPVRPIGQLTFVKAAFKIKIKTSFAELYASGHQIARVPANGASLAQARYELGDLRVKIPSSCLARDRLSKTRADKGV